MKDNMMLIRLLLVLACVVGVCVAIHGSRTEHFSAPLTECNKLMANSLATQNTDCEFVWRAPVFMSKGVTVPDAHGLLFHDTTKGIARTQTIHDVMRGTTNGLSSHCKTDPNISVRINKVVDRANEAVRNDKSLNVYTKLWTNAPEIPYLVDMRTRFEGDLNVS